MMLLSHHVPGLDYADWFEAATFLITLLGVWYSYSVWQESQRHLFVAQTEPQYLIAISAAERTALMMAIQICLWCGSAYSLFAPPPGDGTMFGRQAQITRLSIMAASLIGVRKSWKEQRRRKDLWLSFDRRQMSHADGSQARRNQVERNGPKRTGDA